MKAFLSFLFILPLFAWAQSGSFRITGKIKGFREGTVVKLRDVQDRNSVLAEGLYKSGVFFLNGQMTEPGLFWLSIDSAQDQHLYVEPGGLVIEGDRNDLRNLTVTGSKAHNDFDVFRKTFNPLIGELNAFAAQAQQAPDEAARAVLMLKYDSVVKIVQREVAAYVNVRPASPVSPFVLFVTANIATDVLWLDALYTSLDSSVRQLKIGSSLGQYIAYNKVGAIGTPALPFSQADPNGKAVSLAAYRGKYVLIDFWASWCRPCRQENPNVVKAYNKFKDKNFTILGVSLDQEKEPWIKAIQKDNLTWTQVSDLQSWNNAVAQQYHVSSIPQNFLVDPNGIIVAKNLRAEELEARLCEYLGCK